MKFSLVIPAKNEEKRILLPLLEYYHALKRKFGERKFEILIIVNNSDDYTARVARNIKKTLASKEIKIYDIGEAEAKGRAVYYGLQKAKGKFIAFTDADGSYKAQEIIKMHRLLVNSDADAIIPNRYDKESEFRGQVPVFRKIFSRLFNYVSRILFLVSFKDTQGGAKIFRKRAIKQILSEIVTFGWIFDLNLIISLKSNGYRIIETPIKWMHKGGSKLNPAKNLFPILRELMILASSRYVTSPIKKTFFKLSR